MRKSWLYIGFLTVILLKLLSTATPSLKIPNFAVRQLCVTITDIFIAAVTLILAPSRVVQTQNKAQLLEDGTCAVKEARLAPIRGSHYASAMTVFSVAKVAFGYAVVAPLDAKVPTETALRIASILLVDMKFVITACNGPAKMFRP